VRTAEFNPDDFQNQHQAKMDESLLVKFFLKARPDRIATEKEGRPIYKDVEYIDIKIPGDRAGGVCRPARPRDIARFQKHYDAFKSRTEEVVIEGTPLVEWSLIGRSQAEELSFFNVKTVEQLAAMSDSNAAQFMGMNNLKAKANDWLSVAKENKASDELAIELKKRDDEISELKAAVKALQKKAPRKKRAYKKRTTAKKE
jgi:hypothetical protein